MNKGGKMPKKLTDKQMDRPRLYVDFKPTMQRLHQEIAAQRKRIRALEQDRALLLEARGKDGAAVIRAAVLAVQKHVGKDPKDMSAMARLWRTQYRNGYMSEQATLVNAVARLLKARKGKAK